MFNEKEESHESFGMMSFSRIQVGGGGQVLHGSDLKHNTIIAMRLEHGIKKRGLSHDWYHATGRVAEAYMSQNQFSELITSMNMGEGIPVTLRFTEKEGSLEEPDFVSVVETHEDEFKKQAQDTAQDAKDLLAIMGTILGGSGTVKKADRDKMIKQAEKVVREIACNMPFMEESFNKAIDKTVTDAKGTIEAFYQHRVTEAGLNALNGGQVESPKLLEKD